MSEVEEIDFGVEDGGPIRQDEKGNYSPRSLKKLERSFQ